MYYSDDYYESERARLNINSCEDLVDKRFEKIDWIVEGLLKPGLSVLAGAPKIGKSWMVLQLCLCAAKGEPFMGMKTDGCGVLYISLEDSEMRLQERILRQTEEVPKRMNYSLTCPAIRDDLGSSIGRYCTCYTDTRLVVIDTFQKIREQSGQMSYAGDYAEMSELKNVADQLNICILLVHHTRKMSDSDVINEISGTNGIAGSADTLMILKKEKRSERTAVLSCTGRDIGDRVMELKLDRESCNWTVVTDNYRPEKKGFPPLMHQLAAYMKTVGYFEGSNTEFSERFSEYAGESILPNHLKRQMNRFRYELEDLGVFFLSVRKAEKRTLGVYYDSERAARLRQTDEDTEDEAPHVEDEMPLPDKQKEAAQQEVQMPLPDKQKEAAQQEAMRQEALRYEQSWDHCLDDMPPTPTDDDAPPLFSQYDDQQYSYKPYL